MMDVTLGYTSPYKTTEPRRDSGFRWFNDESIQERQVKLYRPAGKAGIEAQTHLPAAGSVMVPRIGGRQIGF